MRKDTKRREKTRKDMKRREKTRKDTPRDIIQCEKTRLSLDLGRSLAEFYGSGSDESMVADISVPSPFAL